MNSVLRELYAGDLAPFSKVESCLTELKQNRDRAYCGYSHFLDSLPEERKEEFIKLMDCHIELLPLELEQNFIDGFRLGSRLICDIFLPSHE